MAGKLKKVVAVQGGDGGNGTADGLNALIEKWGGNGITKTLVDHNRYTTLATVLALGLFAFVKAYQPTTKDPFSIQKQTLATIQAEHDKLITDLNKKITDSKKRVDDMKPLVEQAGQQLAKKEKDAGATLGILATAAAPFAGPFAPVVLAVGGLVAAGFAADGARKASQVTASVEGANAAAQDPGNDPLQLLNDAIPKLATAITTAVNTKKSK